MYIVSGIDLLQTWDLLIVLLNFCVIKLLSELG
jgi:hypothetical protein